MKFKAYTQKGWNQEKFYIEDENERDLVIYANSADEAESYFVEYLYETSLYSTEETAHWLQENPLYLVEC